MLGCAATPAADPAPTTLAEQVLARVNLYRQRAGVPTVTLDAKASVGCMEHARYMRANRDSEAMRGLNAHHQIPTLPGASAAGAACAKAADLFPSVSDLSTAVDGWMAGLYHRRPILSPNLARIGVGYDLLPDGTFTAALMFLDRVDAPGESAALAGWPVAYPARDQRALPLEFGSEIPNPIPENGQGGYPISLQFPPFDAVGAVTATLVDGDGKPVPFHLSTPERPATSFGQYGVICLIPVQLLRAATAYTVTISATWREAPLSRTWSFTTVGLRSIAAANEADVIAALGQPSLVRGKVRHGGMMDADTVFFALEAGSPSRYAMVSVLMSKAVWTALAGATRPETWRGKLIEVEATPQLVQNKYLNLPIAETRQIRPGS